MGMARLFFHAPRYGVLDECTNATSVDVEEALFEHAARLGITLITITQRTALVSRIGSYDALSSCLHRLLEGSLACLVLLCSRTCASAPCVPAICAQHAKKAAQRRVRVRFQSVLHVAETEGLYCAQVRFHAHELRLTDGEGGWTLRRLAQS